MLRLWDQSVRMEYEKWEVTKTFVTKQRELSPRWGRKMVVVYAPLKKIYDKNWLKRFSTTLTNTVIKDNNILNKIWVMGVYLNAESYGRHHSNREGLYHSAADKYNIRTINFKFKCGGDNVRYICSKGKQIIFVRDSNNCSLMCRVWKNVLKQRHNSVMQICGIHFGLRSVAV